MNDSLAHVRAEFDRTLSLWEDEYLAALRERFGLDLPRMEPTVHGEHHRDAGKVVKGGHDVSGQARDEHGRFGEGGSSVGRTDGDIVAYHGSTAAVVDSVKEKGLTVRGNKRNFEPDEYVGERGQSVYLSKDLGEARGWPGLGGARGPAVVFEVRIPAGEAGKFKEDEFRAGDGTSYRFSSNIPSSWISRYQTQDIRTSKWSDWQTLHKAGADKFYVTLVTSDASPEGEHHRDAGKVVKGSPDQPRDEHGRWTGGAEEIAAVVADYKEHAAINDWLRGDRSPASGNDKDNKALRDKLDAVIAAHTLDRPTTLWRGFGDVDVQTLLNSTGSLRDKAFVSTSTKESVAREMGGGGYVARIEVPAGTNAFTFPNDHQHEVLLPRGSRFQVAGVDHANKILTFRLKK